MLCSFFQSYKSVKAFLPHQWWNEREGLREIIFQIRLTVRSRIPKLWTKIELLEKTVPPILTSSWPREFYKCDSGSFTTLKEIDRCAVLLKYLEKRQEKILLGLHCPQIKAIGYFQRHNSIFRVWDSRPWYIRLSWLALRHLKVLKSKIILIDFD